MLPTSPQNSKMTFIEEYLPVQKVILQDLEILKFTGETFSHLINEYNDIITYSSSGHGVHKTH